MKEKLKSHHRVILDRLVEVSIQSMTNTRTDDVVGSLKQIEDLIEKGCNTVRLSVPSMKEVFFFNQIAGEIQKSFPNVYLIADVHYDKKVAIAVSPFAHKVRINPGNFLSRHDLHLPEQERRFVLKEELNGLVRSCKTHNTRIRVGVNQGSIYRGDKPSDSPLELVEILMEYVEVFRELDFHDLVLSIKSSDPWTMMEANKLLDRNQKIRNWNYPIHLGVTEAGKAWSGRLSSALGIGTTLLNGIGNTIRVSLTENPSHEIDAARSIKEAVRSLSLMDWERILKLNRKESVFDKPLVLHQIKPDLKTNNDWQGDYTFGSEEKPPLDFRSINISELSSFEIERTSLPVLVNVPKSNSELYMAGIILPHLLRNNAIDGLLLTSENPEEMNQNLEVVSDILHLSGKRNLRSTVISCPGCSRTNFELEELVDEVRQRFADLKLTFSVMGCAVNGYGEMMKADIGILGSSRNKVDIYQKQDLLKAAMPIQEVIAFLEEILISKQ